MKTLIKLLFPVVLIILGISGNSYSQWSADSTVNLSICDVTGEQVLPKIARTSDGGCYIGWFDNRSSGYAVYLQRLNASGVKQFAADGLLISNNSQSSSLVDWDLITDDSNNCVLAFTDTRAGTSINPYAYRISPTGVFLWGANGVTLSDSAGTYQANPKIAKTSDGNFVIAWIWSSTPNKVAIQKLSPTGTKLYGSSPYKLAALAGENFTFPALAPSDNGAVILLWSTYTGSFLVAANYKLYATKFVDPATPLWTNPRDTVYSLGKVNGFFVPKILRDGSNGAFFVWQDDRNSTNIMTSYVQHFSSTGVKLFPTNGSAVSTTAGMNTLDAGIAYMPSTQETYTIYKQSNSGQTQMGVFVQKFSANGTRQWTDNGKPIIPLTSLFSTVNQQCVTKDTAVVFLYNEALIGNTNKLYAFRMNRAGDYVWSGSGRKGLAVSSSSKSKFTYEIIPQSGASIVTWSDGRIDGGVYAQDITLNGTLGIITGLGNPAVETPGEFTLMQNYPNPFNPSTNISYRISKNSFVSLKIYDASGKEVAALVNSEQASGIYNINFNASTFASGVYYYKLTAGDFSDVKAMVLIK